MSERVFSPSDAKGGATFEAKSTALVMIEFQNEFATEGGKMHDGVKANMASTNMLPNSVAVCAAARAKGCKIIHCAIMFKDDMSDNPNKGVGILKGCADGKLFIEGTWGAEFCKEMAPQEGDLVANGKKGLDAFPGSTLEQTLRDNNIETVVLGGFLTNCCVESTMRSACEKGYNVVTLKDCTATTSEEGYLAAVNGTMGMFSTVLDSAAFLGQLNTDAAKPELMYFNAPGRANLTRLAFAAGGVDFTDTFVTFGDPSFKEDATVPGQLFKSLPCIKHGEHLLAQSIATACYAAELGVWAQGRLGAPGAEAASNRGTDIMVCTTNEDLRACMYKGLFGDDKAKAAGMKALPASAEKFLSALERALERKTTAGPFFFSQQGPSLADLAVYDNVKSGFPGLQALGVDMAPYPKLMAVVAAVAEDSRIKAYLSK